MSTGADRKANARGGGALERGHGASLERLAELGDALGSVGALSILDAAQHVVGQAVSIQKRRSTGADTKANTTGVQRNGGKTFAFVSLALTEKRTLQGRRAAHLSEVTVLPLSHSQSLLMASAV